MHSVATFKWMVTKFLYSSFWVCLSDISCRVSILFLRVNVYWLFISPLQVNIVYKQNTVEKWTKVFLIHFSKKGDLGITKQYRSITLAAIVAKIFHSRSNLTWGRKNSLEKSKYLSEKSIHNITISDYSSNHRKSMCKKSWGNTFVRRFLPSIWFLIQRNNGVNTTCICHP